MGVEQDGLGLGVIERVFYEVKIRPRRAGGNTGCAQISTARCKLLAARGAFVPMKLQQGLRNQFASGADFVCLCVDKQEYRAYEGW